MGPLGDVNARLRRLPKVDDVLRGDPARRLLERAPRWAVVEAVRDGIDACRRRLLDGAAAAPVAANDTGGAAPVEGEGERWPELEDAALAARVDSLVRPTLRRVLNATGVVLHTNLGRAPLHAAAIERIAEIARGYCNLEYRLDERGRGSRQEHAARLLVELTSAEGALVVNNGAAAVLLALGGLAAGREVIVSRGELVEIGGSFRVPDVMRASGCRLVEVGTTNRTHARDYERAIGAETALLLKVHRSNFAQVGFTADVPVEELAAIARAKGVKVVVDLGSGSLSSTAELGLHAEPTVGETVRAGADVVTFSGDKLLGGPQAGLILATRAVVDTLKGHPLLRALRPDKLSLAALCATLELYRDGRSAEIPTLAMLGAAPPLLRARADRLAALVARAGAGPELAAAVVEARSAVGGGALPLDEPPSYAVALSHPRLDAERLDARLRAGEPPLVGRIADGRLLLDARTLADAELEEAAAVIARAMETPRKA